jgi:hypothetical protein
VPVPLFFAWKVVFPYCELNEESISSFYEQSAYRTPSGTADNRPEVSETVYLSAPSLVSKHHHCQRTEAVIFSGYQQALLTSREVSIVVI